MALLEYCGDAVLAGTIGNKTVTYDFHRMMPGATKVSCSEFGRLIVSAMVLDP